MNTLWLLIIIGVVVIAAILLISPLSASGESFNIEELNKLTGGFDNAVADIGQGQLPLFAEAGQQSVSGSSERSRDTQQTRNELLQNDILTVPIEQYVALLDQFNQVVGTKVSNSGTSGGNKVETITSNSPKSVSEVNPTSGQNAPADESQFGGQGEFSRLTDKLTGGFGGSINRIANSSFDAAKAQLGVSKTTPFGGFSDPLTQERKLQEAIAESQKRFPDAFKKATTKVKVK